MFLAFMVLLMLCGLVGVLVWLGWQRVSEHLNNNEEAKKYLIEHILTPMLLGNKEKESEEKPEEKPVKKTRGTIV